MYGPVDTIAAKIRIPSSNANLVLCTLLAFVLNLNMIFIRSPTGRKIYSTAAGTFLLFYSHGSGAFLNLFLVLSTYLFMAVLPRNAGAVMMAACGFSIMMTVHMYDHMIEATGWKVGTIVQVSFAKVLMFAWNYYDAGIMDDKQKSKNMTQRERYYAEPLKQKPSFFSYISYLLFVGGAYAGPQIEYRIIDDFLNYKGDITKMPRYGNLRPAFRRLVECFLCIPVMMFFGS